MRRLLLFTCVALVTSSCAVLGLSTGCNGTEVVGEFEQVGDLVRAANVQSADVVIGSVTNIQLDDDEWNAVVTMCINEGQRLSADAEAVVRSTSLLGEKFIDLQIDDPGPPFLRSGDVIPVADTSKATELEDVFSNLASVLGTGNLEEINRLTSSQAEILEGRETELRELLSGLRKFTGLLAQRKGEIADAVDSLDGVARTILADRGVLERFLESFADSSTVLADQKEALQDLLFTLDRFSKVSVQLLNSTETGLNTQFEKLRPVLRTAVVNSRNLRDTLRTLATFSKWFPETMPGDYLQLDVCQAHEDDFDAGTNCPQAIGNDNPGRSGAQAQRSTSLGFILNQPLEGEGR